MAEIQRVRNWQAERLVRGPVRDPFDDQSGVVEVHAEVAACWVSQAPVGWAVTPRICTCRVACSMAKKT